MLGNPRHHFVRDLGESSAKVFEREGHDLGRSGSIFFARRMNRVQRLRVVQRRIDLEFAARDLLQIFRARPRDYETPLMDRTLGQPKAASNGNTGVIEVIQRGFCKHGWTVQHV